MYFSKLQVFFEKNHWNFEKNSFPPGAEKPKTTIYWQLLEQIKYEYRNIKQT